MNKEIKVAEQESLNIFVTENFEFEKMKQFVKFISKGAI